MAAQRLGAHGTAWIAIAMASCAGFVDATAFSELNRIYTSHMTGNTASFAFRLVQGGWGAASRYGWVIVCFLIGLLVSASLTHAERRHGIHSAFAAALGLELVLLVAFIVSGRFSGLPEALVVFFPAAAMGAQTVTVTRVGSLRVYTTYLTASLSKFAEAVTEYAFWFWDRTKGRSLRRISRVLLVTPRNVSAQYAALTAGLWIAFFAGALGGSAGDRAWNRVALILPMVILAVIIVIDLRYPVALGEVSDDEIRTQALARRFIRSPHGMRDAL